jgi:predicted nucleotidyltransferase
MKREQFTAKLVRIIETIRAGATPAPVRAVYIFGSYSRGALQPGDLDIIVVHAPPTRKHLESLAQRLERNCTSFTEQLIKVRAWFEVDMRAALRKPGEKVQVILTQDLDDFLRMPSVIKREDLVLLWSEAEQDYMSKLQAIRPNPSAGRSPRDHIVELKRLNDNVSAMQRIVGMIEQGELVFERLPIGEIECSLGDYHAQRLEVCTRLEHLGRDSMRLLPYALWWLEKHQQLGTNPDAECVVWSQSGTHRVHLGRPSLARMLAIFQYSPDVESQCLIPHLRSRQPNELLVFERGVNFSVHAITAPGATPAADKHAGTTRDQSSTRS